MKILIIERDIAILLDPKELELQKGLFSMSIDELDFS